MSLSETEIDRICASVKRGAKLMIGRDFAGRQRIKVTKGPFGLFVQRFELSDGEMQVLRNKLAAQKQRKPLAS